jgi:hypothetical protein
MLKRTSIILLALVLAPHVAGEQAALAASQPRAPAPAWWGHLISWYLIALAIGFAFAAWNFVAGEFAEAQPRYKKIMVAAIAISGVILVITVAMVVTSDIRG